MRYTNLFKAIIVFLFTIISCKKSNENTEINTLENTLNEKGNNSKLKQILQSSINSQFGTSTFSIQSINYQEQNGNRISMIEYRTENGIISYAMYVEVGEIPIATDAQILEANKIYVVDCIGSCDCKEVWHASTNSIDCSCDSCTMKVTEVIQ